MAPRAPAWRKSRYSQNSTECVEVRLAEVVGVRDTKDRHGGQLTVSGAAWHAAIERLRQA
jgi:hypothetical protein